MTNKITNFSNETLEFFIYFLICVTTGVDSHYSFNTYHPNWIHLYNV